LLIASGAALWRALAGAPRPEPVPRVAEGSARPDAKVEVVAALPDRLELRSGPVRLVLLDPPPIPLTETTTETITETTHEPTGG
jgi:hypothetical protein